MKFNRLLLKIAVLTMSVALGAALIWWKVNVSGSKPRWKDTPENRARVLAEARINGWVTAATNSDGTKYYFMGSSKYMFPIRAEELDYMWLWRDNQNVPDEMRGRGTYYGSFGTGPKTYSSLQSQEKLELDLTVDPVAPGTTVEELLQREGK